MIGRRSFRGKLLAGSAVVLVLMFALLLREQSESDRLSRVASAEPFVDATSWRVASLQELPISLPATVRELGRVAWEGRGSPIAFDAKDARDAKFDVFFVSDQGGLAECLTCTIPWLEGRNVGNPAWHPDGRWLLLQIENDEPLEEELELSPLIADASYPGFGLASSLWVYDTLTEEFSLLFEIDGSNGWGTLHPHFSHDGNRITWSLVVSDSGCLGSMQVMVADFVQAPTPHLQNVRGLDAQTQGREAFFETQDFRDDEILLACAPEPNQEPHFMDLCRLDSERDQITRLTRRSGLGGEPGSWQEHAKYIGESDILFVSSQGYPSPIESCDMATASFMKWLKTDLYVANANAVGHSAERLTFWNEPGHVDFCDCGNALASDFSWNAERSAAVIFVQFLNWPRYLPIPIGFDARYYLLDLEQSGRDVTTANDEAPFS
jgi:hypothetical protein